jgi:hypothetical protein
MFPKGTATFTQGSKTVSSIIMSAGDISAVARGSRLDLGTLSSPSNIIEAVDRDIGANTITLRDNFNGTTGTYSFVITYTGDGFRDAAAAMRDSRESLVGFVDSADVNPNPDTYAQRDGNGNIKTGEPIADDDATPYLISRSSVRSYATTLELEGSSPSKTGQRAENQELVNSQYNLAASGYTAKAGDITAANGRVWALQIDSKGMDVESFGLDFDTAIPLAVERCAGVCDILISRPYQTNGNSFTSVSDVTIRFAEGGKLTLNDSADARVISFTSSTNINISNPQIIGNRLNQTVKFDPGAFEGLHFESCDWVSILGGEVIETAGPAVRGRNTSNIMVDGLHSKGCGARTIYISPANNSNGTDVENVTIQNCFVDLREYPSTEVNQWTCISCSHDATSDFRNITAFNNTVYQHPVNTTDSQCIVLAGGAGIIYESNKVYNGGLGLSSFKSNGVSCIGNTCIGQKQHGIEIAHETEGMEVVGNTVDCLSVAGSTCVAVNGVAGAVTDSIIANNTLRNANIIISSAAADNASRNQGVTINGNRTSGAISHTVSLKWMDDITATGNAFNHGGTGAVFRMDESGSFNITGNTFKAPSAWCVELLSSVTTNIDWGVLSGNVMEDIDFPNILTNYVKNNLSTGSTVGRVAGRGNTGCPDFIDWFNNVIVVTGDGSPEGSITASVGSEYIRLDGGAGTTRYYKESGTGDTGWVAK